MTVHTAPSVDEPHVVLTARLDELTAVTPYLVDLPTYEVRGHVEGMRTFLHDEVLPQAHAEEVALFPIIERLRTPHGPRLRVALTAQHDTIREVAGRLATFTSKPLTTPRVHRVSGLLEGLGVLLGEHLEEEADASTDLLDALAEVDRTGVLTAVVGAAAPTPRTRPEWWLPELLMIEASIGSADLLEPEGMVGCSCPPGAQAVVRSAIAAASEDVAPSRWRQTLREHSRYRLQVPIAEACMRDSGLWPWS